ncbi:carboxymuconolactone decarboxylase family protein [Paenibacillus arenilitoris]|uniref:Carboxymuconolactone decarboxylase family protein n=1 Tax=Paenibacillus arenilitoris TaxID=2772299 RepID=A0A927CMN0_9BACL|nr:carboxymuconolactone decarboxylase family protein [Paenibacillus arenilitoris]MBD2870824.1 carboxymuconolactone decarboxylase family protein [Paenibacillus arenilitoris]
MNPYYDRSNLSRIPDLMALSPRAAAAYLSFEKEIYQSSEVLPPLTKELIAVAVAHVTGCPYCIDVHVQKGKALGGTREEIFEAVLVAASTRAGAVLSHATHALSAFEEPEDPPSPKPSGGQSPPDCFC